MRNHPAYCLALLMALITVLASSAGSLRSFDDRVAWDDDVRMIRGDDTDDGGASSSWVCACFCNTVDSNYNNVDLTV